MFKSEMTAGVILALTILCGCGNEKKVEAPPPQPTPVVTHDDPAAKPAEPEKKPAAEAPKEAPAAETATITFGKDTKHTMSVPKAWLQEEPSNNMRLLQMKIPHLAGDSDDGDFGLFKMFGGGADANIKRWIGQFGGGDDALKSRKDVKTASGDTATIADLEGTYAGMGSTGIMPAKSDYKMLGAIIETSEGEYFIKSAGPQKTMQHYKEAFEKMVESFK